MNRIQSSPAIKPKLIATIGTALVKLLCATLRFRIHDPAGFLRLPPTVQIIGAFWHNRLLIIPWFFTRYMGPRGASALTSASQDGDLVAAALARFGIGAIRGSSSRRGAVAMLEMRRTLAAGSDIAITPDGPRGPRYRLHPGIIALSQHSGIPILPICVSYSRFWELPSWDAFQIPHPFATVEVTLLPLEQISATSTAEDFERHRARVEHLLRYGHRPTPAPAIF